VVGFGDLNFRDDIPFSCIGLRMQFFLRFKTEKQVKNVYFS